MLPRHLFLQVHGIKLKSLTLNPPNKVLLQSCLRIHLLAQDRQKQSLFPKHDKSQRQQYDVEAELGGRRAGRRRQQPTPPLDSVPEIPYGQPIVPDTVGTFLSDYIPLEKKDMVLTPRGLKQRWEAFKMFLISTYSLAVIRRNSKSFKVRQFADDAQKAFIASNVALQEKDEYRLGELMVKSVEMALREQFWESNKRIFWRFIKTINRPRVIHARVAPVQEKTNLFAQVTVKMHTEQILAITDNHGRRLKGDKKKSKQVIDYVVFEKHLVNPYGQWKIIGKLIPQQQIPASKLLQQKQAAQLARP